MKKLLFALTAVCVLAFTSCKKAKDTVDSATDTVTDAADATVEGATAVVDSAAGVAEGAVSSVADAATGLLGADFTMPEFKNPEVGTWANNLVSTSAELKNALKEGDMEGANELKTKFEDLAGQLRNFAGSEDFASATALVKKVTEAVNN